MKTKHRCKKCNKAIVGKIRLVSYRQKLGSKSVNRVDMYCESCFKTVNKERALRDEHSKQKRANQRKG